MKVLSLFDGISCGMVALERAGINVEQYIAYEIDPNAIKISKKNYPQIIHCGDVIKADFTQYRGFDAIIAGFPCQDLSINTPDRKGLKGKRSGLFCELFSAIDEVNPTYLFVENNYKMPVEDMNTITETLGVQPILIDSCTVSGQTRKRLYWTNIPILEQPKNKHINVIDILQNQSSEQNLISEVKFNGKENDTYRQDKPIRIGSIGNGGQAERVYSVYGKSVTLKANGGGRGAKTGLYLIGGTVRKLTPVECERLQTLPDNYTLVDGISDTQRIKTLGNGWTVDVIAHILSYIPKQEREVEQMELKIYSPSEDGFVKEITWNHEEIKKEVAEKVSYYANLVYTDDQIKDAKSDRAKLNKFVQALESKRKDIKKQCLAPYEDFEKKMKEITAIVNEPIRMIDQQVKSYEEQKKAEKLEKIKEYWQEKEKPFAIEFERIMDSRWMNASTSMKSVQASIDALLEQIEKDLATLRNLPEFGFESTEVYKSTLDIGKAIQEGHRLSEIQKRKQEHEAEQARLKAEAEAKKQEETITANVKVVAETQEGNKIPIETIQVEVPAKQWISFKALLSVNDAKALKAFFDSRNIEFEAI